MATIIDSHATGDGWDVRILLNDAAETLHFTAQPDDVNAAVEAILAVREAERVVYTLKGEADA